MAVSPLCHHVSLNCHETATLSLSLSRMRLLTYIDLLSLQVTGTNIGPGFILQLPICSSIMSLFHNLVPLQGISVAFSYFTYLIKTQHCLVALRGARLSILCTLICESHGTEKRQKVDDSAQTTCICLTGDQWTSLRTISSSV